jgi:septal ring factor EnvC (AmiA/AmiB activator)
MKKMMVFLMAASLLAASVPAMAMDHGDMRTKEQIEQCQKDCNLLAKNCMQGVDSIQQRIQKLQKAIQNKGNTYTLEQLNRLKENLAAAQNTLSNLEGEGLSAHGYER